MDIDFIDDEKVSRRVKLHRRPLNDDKSSPRSIRTGHEGVIGTLSSDPAQCVGCDILSHGCVGGVGITHSDLFLRNISHYLPLSDIHYFHDS